MDQLPDELSEDEASKSGTMSVILDGITTFLGHIPASLQRNVLKAVNHLFKVPNAYLDGIAEEIKATSEARVQLTKATGKALADAVAVDLSLAQIATQTHAGKILRQQKNTVKVLHYAAAEIQRSPPAVEDSAEPNEINEDWLNAFETEAVNMSSEQMQRLFGKILAGEIHKPGSYSIRTLRIMAQIDNNVAKLFRKFCSLTCTLYAETGIINSSVVTLGSSDENNALRNPRMGFIDLRRLVEYGLVFDSTPARLTYSLSVPGEHSTVKLPITYNHQDYVLVPIPPKNGETFKKLTEFGVSLSIAGAELLNIVDFDEHVDYTEALTAYFANKGLEFRRLDSIVGDEYERFKIMSELHSPKLRKNSP
jgi:hypothetical protein